MRKRVGATETEKRQSRSRKRERPQAASREVRLRQEVSHRWECGNEVEGIARSEEVRRLELVVGLLVLLLLVIVLLVLILLLGVLTLLLLLGVFLLNCGY